MGPTTLSTQMPKSFSGEVPTQCNQLVNKQRKFEVVVDLDMERHRGENVVFTMRLTPGFWRAPSDPKRGQCSDGGVVKFFKFDGLALEEKSNQLKSRKATSKQKQQSETSESADCKRKRKSSDHSNECSDDSGEFDVKQQEPKPEKGYMVHAKALVLSETFYKMNIAHVNDQQLLLMATDSKEVSWAFQLFLLNCDLQLACKIAGRYSSFAGILAGNIYGNYAVQKMIIRMPVFRKLMASLCETYFWSMVYNQYSSRVLQLLSEIHKPFAKFALNTLLQSPNVIGSHIETAFLVGAALRSIKGASEVHVFGMEYIRHYQRTEQVAKGKFTKKVVLSLAQNAEGELLNALQQLLLSTPAVVKQYLGDRAMMQFFSTIICKLHKPSLEMLFLALQQDNVGIMNSAHAAGFFKKVGRYLSSSIAREVEQRVSTQKPLLATSAGRQNLPQVREMSQAGLSGQLQHSRRKGLLFGTVTGTRI